MQCPAGATSDARSAMHAFINDTVWHALNRAGIQAMQQPHGLTLDDGNVATDYYNPHNLKDRPQRYLGRHIHSRCVLPCTACLCRHQLGGDRSQPQNAKKTAVPQTHLFYPIAIEKLDPICSDGRSFLSELGTRIIRRRRMTPDKWLSCFKEFLLRFNNNDNNNN